MLRKIPLLNKIFSTQKDIIFEIVDSSYYHLTHGVSSNPILDFKENGVAKNRNPNPAIDILHLKNEYGIRNLSDLISLLQRNDIKWSSHFDSQEYLALNPDVKEGEMSAILHFLKFGRFERRRFQKNRRKLTYAILAKHGDQVNQVEDYRNVERKIDFDNVSNKPFQVIPITEEYLILLTQKEAKVSFELLGTKFENIENIGQENNYYIYDIKLPIIVQNTFLFSDISHQLIFSLKYKSGEIEKIIHDVYFPKIPILRIEKLRNNKLSGWYYSGGSDSQALHLEADDTDFKIDFESNKERPDIAKLLPENLSNLGFEVQLPFNIQPGDLKITIPNKDNIQFHIPKHLYEAIPSFKNSQLPNSFRFKLSNYLEKKKVSVIIPIYNAYDDIVKCVDSLLTNTFHECDILLINDCSTDDRIVPFLNSLDNSSNLRIIHNQENLGYTNNIIKGINLASDSDVVLLNSDTIVTEYWLRNLYNLAYSDADFGTLTALSNNAGAFSVPEVGTNKIPHHHNIQSVGRAITGIPISPIPQLPTGNGFCLYIKRKVFETIGNFDSVNFPRGYGEENEFCMRAQEAGFKNIICNKSYVYHTRSASFKDEKAKLIKEGREKLDELFPSYTAAIQKFKINKELFEIRSSISTTIGSNEDKKPLRNILFVISTSTGGTPKTNMDLMRSVSPYFRPYVLRCDSERITLVEGLTQKVLVDHTLLEPITLIDTHNSEYEQVVGSLLYNYNFALVHIRQLIWHSLSFVKITKGLSIPVVLSFHDYYLICPSLNLLDNDNTYCGGRCTTSVGNCGTPTWKDDELLPPLKHKYVNTWRKKIKKIIHDVDHFATTVKASKDLFVDIYPELNHDSFSVIEHGRDFESVHRRLGDKPSAKQRIKLLFPGNISESKGAAEIKALSDISSNEIEFHFLGRATELLYDIGTHHGAYTREDYFEKVEEIRPHFVCIFSIWPETYCHTLTESWAAGIPILSFGMGALEERIRLHGGAWILRDRDKHALRNDIISIYNDHPDYQKKIDEIQFWQKSVMSQNGTMSMANSYLNIYEKVIQAKKPFRNTEIRDKYILGVFTNDNATSHIRVREWLYADKISSQISINIIDSNILLNDVHNHLKLDGLLIQRNNFPIQDVESVIQYCEDNKIDLFYEYDDDLENLPEERDPEKQYVPYKEPIALLKKRAKKIFTSTEVLVDEKFNNKTYIIPNCLNRYSWYKPVENTNFDLGDHLKLVYFGSPTHKHDLELLKAPILELKKKIKGLELYVLGVQSEQDDADNWFTRIAIPGPSRYYPDFVTWLRSVANNFDIGLAPLVESNFNNGKSNLKYLQYAALGLPCVASNVTTYNSTIIHKENGILVDNNVDGWINGILEFVSDGKINQLSNTCKDDANQLILQQFLIEHYAEEYIKNIVSR